MPFMILSAQITTIIAWIAIVFNWVHPINGYYDILNYTGLGLAAAHMVETLVFLPKAKKVGGNMAVHIVQLLVFGYVHNMVMDKQLSGKA
jgi:uncharacterized protein YhhL (DUF1145 family)